MVNDKPARTIFSMRRIAAPHGFITYQELVMRALKRFSTIIAATLLATAAGCASTETQKSTGEYIDDAAITAKVETALIRDDSLDAIDINIETYKGVVQLSGFVDSEEDVDEAEEVARNVNGVVDVENDLRVKGDD